MTVEMVLESLERSTVVGVHDAPGLEVGDFLLNDVPDLVDLGVEFFLPVQEFAVLWFLDRGEHLVSDVSLVADPVGRVHREKDTGFAEAVVIVAAPFDGIRNPGELSIEPGAVPQRPASRRE